MQPLRKAQHRDDERLMNGPPYQVTPKDPNKLHPFEKSSHLLFNKSCQQIMHLPSTILLSAFLAAVTGLASPVAQAAPTPTAVAADDVQLAAAHHGEATYYNQEGGIGSCGQRHQDSDKIVALPARLQPGQPPKNCGRRIRISNTSGPGKGKKVTATVADTCPGCQGDHIGKGLSLASKALSLFATEGKESDAYVRVQ
ncbi:MAG: hypothetical protein LQ342_004412 [Letrouitia transgressa]|nr:MAG: hypothetical protein LQ342_004412 [Letrouitia transgressa]